MPVKTRQQVQTPIPFKCRKTCNSSNILQKTSFEMLELCSSVEYQKSTNTCRTLNGDDNRVHVHVLKSRQPTSTCTKQVTCETPGIMSDNSRPVRSGSRSGSTCRSGLTKSDSAKQSGQTTSPSSPRKRTLLQEVSRKEECPSSPCSSPRKMKKENIPIQTDNAIGTNIAMHLSSGLRQYKRCTDETTFKELSSPRVHHIRNSPEKAANKEPNFLESPLNKRRGSIADQSINVIMPGVKQSPIMMLEKAGGESYQKTKQALHTALPDRLLCRDKELEMMTSFLKNHLTKSQAGSLYISGAPGTGKTACLSQVLNHQKKVLSKTQVMFVNCMSVRYSQGIYGKIWEEVNGGNQRKMSAKDAAKKLQKTFTSPGPMVVLVLDEIDHLDCKGQEVLYTMFEWPSLCNSRLILIGVANALDLTDRILPRFQARPKCKPELLHFRPYSKDQIATILLDRVQISSDDSVVEPVALQLCARKVAAVAGDIRKALDVCRRAVEIVECDVKSQLLFGCRSSVTNHGPTTCMASSRPGFKSVGVKQISSVISEVYGSRLTTSSNHSQTFPLQQKLMICTVLLMVRGGRLKEITLGKCHETYSKLCKDRRVPAVEQSEFLSLCQLVESRGLISLKYSKDTRQTKIGLKLNEKEVETALQDKVLLSSILQGDVPTKKK